jgi:hypothetical protein
LRANLGNQPSPWTPRQGRVIYSSFDVTGREMGPWSVAWYLNSGI